MIRVEIDRLLSEPEILQRFCADMASGAVAVLPTDTLYGFAVAAHQPAAVARVYGIKNRSEHKPLILFVHAIECLAELGIRTSPELREQLCRLWPGALTAVLPAPPHAMLGAFTFATIGVRIPAHTALLRLLATLEFKLLTTSANRSGDPSDIDPDNIAREFAEEIDWFVDGGILPEAMASTVADFSVVPPRILRQGKIKL